MSLESFCPCALQSAMAPARTFAAPVLPARVRSVEDVFSTLSAHGRPFDPELLGRVYEFSREMHKDQLRRSGEPYLIHPLNVAWLLADLNFDQTCVAVGLLHDVLEDTLTSREVLEKEFGSEIAELVDGVTKIGRHEYVRRDEAQAETFRKMILASAKDIRVVLVKLADRLHNMQTLEPLTPESRRRISRETLEIYAPIAHRLGMAKVKGDLEDLAFFYLWPHQFGELHSKIAEKMRAMERDTQRIRERLARSLEEAGIDAEISFRVKRYYSIFQKLQRQGVDIDQLYDYLAFRIVTVNLRDTYAALGVVHQNWRPIPGRFKDYIAMPKPNLYQSLHTTAVGERGQPFEVQIRTREMDLIAEEGIAAHWRYKEGRLEPAVAGAGTIRTSSGCASSSSGRRTCRTRAPSSPRSRSTSIRTRSTCSRPRATCSRSRAVRLRSTSPTGCTPTSATTARGRGSTAGWCRCARGSRTATWSRSSPTRTATRAATG